MAGAQWTYEKSPAYLGSGPLPPALARVLLPSVKLVAILRNPTSRAYSAFQHNCRFGRWRTTTATAATTTTTKGERGKSNIRGGGRSASSGGGSSGGDSSGSGGLIVNCDAAHDEKFARSKPSATTTEPGAGGALGGARGVCGAGASRQLPYVEIPPPLHPLCLRCVRITRTFVISKSLFLF